MNYNEEKSGILITEEDKYKVLCSKYYNLFNTTDGKDVLNDILNISGFNNKLTAYNKIGELDHYQIILNEGARQLAIEILQRINKNKQI